jgi:hypothetical protein
MVTAGIWSGFQYQIPRHFQSPVWYFWACATSAFSNSSTLSILGKTRGGVYYIFVLAGYQQGQAKAENANFFIDLGLLVKEIKKSGGYCLDGWE